MHARVSTTALTTTVIWRVYSTFGDIDDHLLVRNLVRLQEEHHSPTWLRKTVEEQAQSHFSISPNTPPSTSPEVNHVQEWQVS